MRFDIRAPKVIYERKLTPGDITITAGGAFAAVAGTACQFAVGKDSQVEIRVEGVGGMAAAASLMLDLSVDGSLQGNDDGLTQVVQGSAAALQIPFAFSVFLDDLAAGVHTLSLQAKAVTANAVINAATTSNPLRITVIEHALVYPPTS